MKDAPIVILDEATANVDPENEKELMDAGETLEGANAASAGEPAEESGRDGGSEQIGRAHV